MKSILMSIQPYWGFLIIAKGKGLDLKKYGLHEKTVEARKGVPTSPDWDKKVALYFSKDKKSLARIPEEYRGEVAKLCGKVVGEFVCDSVLTIDCDSVAPFCKEWDRYCGEETGLSAKELFQYSRYICKGLHISDLKIYDKPKELSEFNYPCKYPKNDCLDCAIKRLKPQCHYFENITRPPQSWCYVEEL